VIELHGMGSPNVLKIVLMLEELGLPYRLNWIDIIEGDQFKPPFLRLNPNGKVPVIVDPDGPSGTAQTVFESGAILIYLAEKTGQFLPAAGPGRYEVLQWLMIQLTGIGPAFGQHVHFTRYKTEGEEYARSRHSTEARRLVALVEERLGAAAYLGGDAYSIADIATYPWLRLVEPLGIVEAAPPGIARWRAAIEGRSAAARMIAIYDELGARTSRSLGNATPEAFDRLFGRGRYARA
jgi:GST-like protein